MNDYDKTSIQINRCKRILELVDTYVDCQTQDHRTALRKALMEEFEAPTIAPPVAAGSVDTTEFKRLCNALYLANPPLREGERLRLVDHLNAWGAQQREAEKMEVIATLMPRINHHSERAEKAEARVKELELDLMLKNPLIEELRHDIDDFRGRVKELEGRFLTVDHHPV